MSDELHPHQCPYCELRFRFAGEVKDHVVRDHPSHRHSFETWDPREHSVPQAPSRTRPTST
jgi:hypothetical protein